MIRFGAVNIDTSHPLGFAEALEKTGRARYTAVYDDSFRGDDEVAGFINRFGLEKRCQSLEELAGCCDIALLHGCNWDDHLRTAMPFIERGVPVFIDKPVAGNLRDCRRLEQLAGQGAVILGASSARYAYELQAFLALPLEERGEMVHVMGTAGVDEFNYGIHIAEIVGGLLGTGAQWVRWAGRGEAGGCASETQYVQFASGQSAVFNTFTGVWQPFALTVMTSKTTHQLKLDSARLYAALMDELCDYLEGKPNRLVGVPALTESVKVMLAGRASRAAGGAPVRLDALDENDPGFDGLAFWQGYGAAAGKLFI